MMLFMLAGVLILMVAVSYWGGWFSREAEVPKRVMAVGALVSFLLLAGMVLLA